MKFLLQSFLAIILLTVCACSDGNETVPGETQDAPRTQDGSLRVETPAKGTSRDEPFAFQRLAVDDSGDAPLLCLHFTEALEAGRDYAPFIGIDRSVAVTAEGQRLCVAGLGYGDEASLTLRAGLPSADGETLPEDESVQLTFEDRPPFVGFAGNGVILPMDGADGLGITTVNVPAVDVTITRIDDRALAFRNITEGMSSSEGQYAWAPYDEQPGELGATVFEGSLETEGPTNAVTTTLLPIREAVGTLEAGAYYVEIVDAEAVEQGRNRPARAARWVMVTDLALVAYRGSTGLDVTVRDITTARPVSGASVGLVSRGNEILASERSGRDGRVHFDAPLLEGTDADRPKLLTAAGRGKGFAILDLDRAPLDLSSQPVSGRPEREGTEAFIYLDRGIYRPGETVHATSLLRDAEGFAAESRPGALVLVRPNGIEQARLRFSALEEAGSLQRSLPIPQAAMRGMWRLVVELDGLGEVGSIRFNVEDFVPQRLALELAADETPVTPGETRMIEARARFLYGAPGTGLTVDGTARIETDPSPFPDFRDFVFGLEDDPYRDELIELPDVTTDGEGTASLPLAPGQRGSNETAPLRIRAVVRVEEPGGRAVQDDIRIPYRTRDRYLGIGTMAGEPANRGEPYRFELLLLDRDGSPVDGTATWRIDRRDYDYDWYEDENGRWRWRRSERKVLVGEGETGLSADGPASVAGPSLDWGEYTLTASLDGEEVSSRNFWIGYGGRSADGTPAPDSVRVLLPEGPARTGEPVTIAIDPPYAGWAEVAVATSRVISLEHIEVPAEGTELTLEPDEAWGAGAYILVSLYTDRQPGLRPVPRRAVGAAYLPLDTEGRTYEVDLDVPEVARPDGTVTLTLDHAGGPGAERAYATVAAVDEGILLLTGYETPDPADALFGKAELGVEIHDDYGRILDANTGETGLLRSGGDQIGGAGLTVVPTKTVALFQGPVPLEADGSTEISFELPQFNGELRLMAVVWSESAVGSAAEPMTVREPVPVELVLPRFLAPGDEALATLTLDNIEGSAGSYTYTVSATSGTPRPKVVAPGDGSIDLEAGERDEALLPVSALLPGVTEFSLRISGPEGYSDRRSYPLEVRDAFLPVRRITERMLAPGESFVPGDDMFAGFLPGSGELFVSASASPINADALSRSLTAYPYACTEQVVSSAIPLLTMTGRTTGEERQLREAISTLLERQSGDGAFGLWRVGDRQASPWLGAYVTDFLLLAEAEGLPVPEDSLRRALAALQPVARGEPGRAYGYDSRMPPPAFTTDTEERLKQRSEAYALYVLTRADSADRSRLRYLHDAQLDQIKSPLALAQLAAALARIGDAGRAQSAFAAARERLGYENPGTWYQSPRRDAAGLAFHLSETGQPEVAAEILRDIDDELPQADSLSTQEKAFLLKAVRSFGLDEVMLRYDGSLIQQAVLDERDDLGQPFANESDRPIFVTAVASGTPSKAPPAISSDLRIEKAVLDADGRDIDPSDITQGDRFVVRLTLTPERAARAQYVINDFLPAGFEIETVLRPGDGAPDGPYADLGTFGEPDIAEARDDRFVASAVLQGRDPLTVAYIVRAVTPGRFTLPGAFAEDMYREGVFARSASGEVVIRR
jgi:uncharacterized protein YfaS (alpha-2-macroglobulin family)